MPGDHYRRALATFGFTAWLALLATCLTPLALLRGFADALSADLSKSACNPSGDFVLPFTSSIWDAANFFEITVPFAGARPETCSHSGLPFETTDCTGYTFTQVKVADLAWDLLVGRGGQGVLIIAAYQLFSRVLLALMHQDVVSYDVFGPIVFETGTLSGSLKLFRRIVRSRPMPRTRRAVLCYWAMLFATIYIVAFPSLVSAMTGYTPRFKPYIRRGYYRGANGTLGDCQNSFVPAWGLLGISDLEVVYRARGNEWEYNAFVTYVMPGTNASIISHDSSDHWIDCKPIRVLRIGHYQLIKATSPDYKRYEDVYDVCPKDLSIPSCASAQKNTTLLIVLSGETLEYNVYAPMPGILPLADNSSGTTGKSAHRYWQCGDEHLVDTHGLSQSDDFEPEFDDDDMSVGLCKSDKTYAWGFSFLFAFLVAVLQAVFALLMCSLWLANRAAWSSTGRQVASGIFPDAVAMVTQAQRQHGAELDQWSPKSLKRDVLHGPAGMALVRRGDMARQTGDIGAAEKSLKGDACEDGLLSDHFERQRPPHRAKTY